MNKYLIPAVAMLATACTVDKKDSAPTDSSTASAPAVPAPAAMGDTTAAERVPSTAMTLEVNVKTRTLSANGDSGTPTYPVAVGSTKWPTQTGDWHVKQVVINPEWTPPDESWAEEREPREPGDPKNPLGKAQLVYDVPRSIHGTNDPASIGKAVSHGSIRMRNQDIIALAVRVLKAGGATEDSAWVQQALANPKEKKIVDLPNPSLNPRLLERPAAGSQKSRQPSAEAVLS